MRIFNSIKKMWLQSRVYRCRLKKEDASSDSEQLLKLAKYHENQSLQHDYGCADEHAKLATKYGRKGEHYKHVAAIYLEKETDLMEKLCKSNHRRVK